MCVHVSVCVGEQEERGETAGRLMRGRWGRQAKAMVVGPRIWLLFSEERRKRHCSWTRAGGGPAGGRVRNEQGSSPSGRQGPVQATATAVRAAGPRAGENWR